MCLLTVDILFFLLFSPIELEHRNWYIPNGRFIKINILNKRNFAQSVLHRTQCQSSVNTPETIGEVNIVPRRLLLKYRVSPVWSQ